MNTTELRDVDIELRGTLLWDTNIPYWLAYSLPIGFQNQTSAWHLGGERIHFYGHGYGTLDGNGQAWYDFNQGVSNRHGRPHAILIEKAKDSVIEGLRFVKSQMWTMTVARSERVLLQDIYVNNTSDDRDSRSNVNTDGVDTVYADSITFLRWIIDNGDDSISMKQNSTNIYIADCDFYNGQSLAMGSIGQYPGQIGIMENITAENIRCHNTAYAARVKTWTGVPKGQPPNGGGGGLGLAKNITFRDFTLNNVNVAWAITQCTSYNGERGDCDTSTFKIEDMNWGDANGTLKGDRVATLWCSGAAPCTGINLFNNTLWALDQEIPSYSYLCEAVESTENFNCTHKCNGDCPK
ncbi:glycoside hydrolase family 28 protein [Dothistroma septosporum NZE10]|uniref:Glycoside hydrolase family 28 protein n=1 Tax=Dothistroma septosporum (strain NZE10 / CBS 128990) TaxID=675120 RepID=N1PM33_DOTSN|nr:glycoside hydrolase family 28 protein [Dothistroma septosporum NZE10]